MIMNKNIKYWLKEKASKNLFNMSKTYAIFTYVYQVMKNMEV